LEKTLIVGYGNADRQDDGVAWHVLRDLAERYAIPHSEEIGEGFEWTGAGPHFLFVLQLTPELAETLSGYERACFVDAHTGAVPHDLQCISIDSEYQTSPFTHHMTPQTLLSLAQALYGESPSAVLVSIRGYAFGFSNELSPGTARLAGEAAQWIEAWLSSPDALPPCQPGEETS